MGITCSGCLGDVRDTVDTSAQVVVPKQFSVCKKKQCLLPSYKCCTMEDQDDLPRAPSIHTLLAHTKKLGHEQTLQ